MKSQDLEEAKTEKLLTNPVSHFHTLEEKEYIGAHSFTAHELLGTGSFGEVYLVEKISDGTLHAMKVLSKEKIAENKLT